MLGLLSLALTSYAAFLTWLHSLAGVQTDEAKYLLDIAYPHPPLLRWIMGQTSAWEYQELFWRFVLANLVVQAVWLVWDMTRGLPRSSRLAVSAVWLLSPSILLQGGTVMLAPVTAVTTLFMLWMLLRQRQGMNIAPEIWGFIWAFAVLSAYQGVMLLPLAVAGVLRSRGSLRRKAGAVLLPLVLLFLVTVTNPLAIATMLIHSGEGARMTAGEHVRGAAMLLVMSGAIIAGIVGTLGLLARPRWEIFGAFAFMSLFVLASAPFPFYGILFLPFLVEGIRNVFVAHRAPPQPAAFAFIILLVAGVVWLKPWNGIPTEPSAARVTMQAIASRVSTGTIAIQGTFGHQWAYESPLPVMRYIPGQLDGVSAVVCLNACENPGTGWEKIEAAVGVWVKE